MQTFKKQERLCSRKIIDHLFTSGKNFKVPPFIVNWNEFAFTGPAPAQVLMAVSSRNIRHATERNYIKRLMREAYRKNKSSFLEYLTAKNRKCAFIIIFTGREKLTWTDAESKIILILRRLQSKYEETSG
jgi:ribonuclease P protein component